MNWLQMRSLLRTLPTILLAGPLVAQSSYVPATELPQGREIVAVYIGATTCAPCMSPEVKSAVQRMKGLMAAQAKQTGAAFSIIGASTDWSVTAGAAFLEPNGPFDQIVVGGNWTNLAVERFIWQDSTSRSGMPQVVVYERTVVPGARGIKFSEPRLLRRIVGGDSIPAWVAAGAPIGLAKKP